MKRLMLPCLIVLCFCRPVWGGGDNAPYNEPWPIIALFSDSHASDHCLSGMGSFAMYCFVLPGYNAISCVSFSVSTSSEDIGLSSVSFNPDWSVTAGGELPGDLQVCYCECFWCDWHLVFSAAVNVGIDTPQSVSVGPFAGESGPIAHTCDGRTEWAHGISLMINDPDCWPIADEESTWGAIKRLCE